MHRFLNPSSLHQSLLRKNVCYLKSRISEKASSSSTWSNLNRIQIPRKHNCSKQAGDAQLLHHDFRRNYASNYYDEMHKAWTADPKSVHSSWGQFFGGTSSGSGSGSSATMAGAAPSISASSSSEDIIGKHLTVNALIRNFQAHGHYTAQLDPLKISSGQGNKYVGERDLDNRVKDYMSGWLDESDLDTVFKLPSSTFIGGDEKKLPLHEILRRLKDVYTSSIGTEFYHLSKLEQLDWIKSRLEPPNSMQLTNEVRLKALSRLSQSHSFEMFLAKKWASEKRFGLEGCEVLIPAMQRVIDLSSAHGVESVVIGMPHRGRLNVLANVCRKPLVQLFSQFAGLQSADPGSGDVKYHLGTCVDVMNNHSKKNIRVAVVANPSHLEAVNPIVQGKVAAEQFYRGDTTGEKVMPILLHGDAAFAGQGVVFETIHLSGLPQYTTFGTIHFVVNNQVGFTTDPRFSRSSPYCTDVGRVVQCPIFHVNGDDPDAVIHVCNIAADWRAKFHTDVIIDLICYRRNGHNEIDEPMFTQPLMYRKIKKIKPILELYSQKLIQEGVVTADKFDSMKAEYDKLCEDALNEAKSVTEVRLKDWLDSPWKGFFKGKKNDSPTQSPTGVDEEVLQHIGTRFSSPPPDDFVIHKGIERILKGRKELVSNRTVDWALGEAMTFGSLLKDGIHVRLSGQDVERGTFSHRHHVLHHQNIDKAKYNSLSHLYPDQAVYSLCNSSLSEFGVLGFELGYSMTSPQSLVMWEAQFGDFNNTAQCIIDQFMSSGQSKWVRQSGLVLLLPHGMEGMGPEHSSARIERFLQMSDDDPDTVPELNENTDIQQLHATNWIVANCSTPANYFHIIRRQLALSFRKPMILLTPKSLLRHPEARSSFDDMKTGSEFQPVIGEPNSGSYRRLIFCYGRAYYDLRKAREERGKEKEVALARLEQLTPFPYRAVQAEAQKHSGAEVMWAQEEHKNNGPWTYVQPRINNLLKTNIKYAGRGSNASPATGSKHQHYKEFNHLLDTAFG